GSVNLLGSSARVGLSGGAIQNGTLTLDPGQALHVDNPGTLSNLKLVGNLDLTTYDGVYVNVTNGLTLNGTASVGSADGNGNSGHINFYGTQTIGGTGDILLGGRRDNYLWIATGASTVTFGPSLTVHGMRGFLHSD